MVLHKDRLGRFGLGIASVSGSILVNFVQRSSPAELAGLQFGDEITSVSGSSGRGGGGVGVGGWGSVTLR